MISVADLYAIYLDHRIISTDTRRIVPGSIFFALKGNQFDGNLFAHQALDEGAAYAVVSDPSLASDRMLYTEDTLLLLQHLAHHHRQKSAIPVIAITGSNGKTTTKELINAVLSSKFIVHATAGNLNNHIGVPLTILSAPADTQLMICEMGANHIGEIASLCAIAEPTHGLITNIGKAHLEGFGSLEGVQKGKGELFDFLRLHQGTAFVNTDDPRLLSLSYSIPKKVTYGFQAENSPDYCFSITSLPEDEQIRLQDTKSELCITSGLYGHYNAINILAAFSVGREFGVEPIVISEVMSGFISKSNRSEKTHYQNCVVIKDAYNANPSSMELAVRTFAAQYPHGLLVLGDMKEGGDHTELAHREIIHLVSSMSFEKIWLIGPEFAKALQSETEKDSRIISLPDIQSLRSTWEWTICQHKGLLLKGSRSMQLEKLLEP